MTQQAKPDVTIRRDGSLFLFTPQTPQARYHLLTNVSAESQWFAGALVVDARYSLDLYDALTAAGFTVGDA